MSAIYVVCYDISDDDLREAAAKALLAWGDRVQRSVFEIMLKSPKELDVIKATLKEVLGADCDVRFYRLCIDCRAASATLAGKSVADFPAVIIV